MEDLRRRFGSRFWAIAGGPHPNGDPQGTIAMGFNWAGVGEAGPVFAALVRDLVEGRAPSPGLVVEEERFPLERYRPWPASGQLFCSVEITRGCPLGCAFCQTPRLHGTRPRHRPVEDLERIFAHGVQTGHTYTRFIAPNSFAYASEDGRTTNPRAVERLVVAARRAGMTRVYLGTFPSEVRPESVTPEVLSVVRDHCDNHSIVVGLQSGSPEMLRRLRRGHTVEQGVSAVAAIAAFGFLPRVDFIFGLPGESDRDRRFSRDLILHLTSTYGAYVNTHLFSPLPGTALEDAVPTALDPTTQELLEVLTGRGKANALRCFRSAVLAG
jgi:B12-binding domain/radical SAM domain protein